MVLAPDRVADVAAGAGPRARLAQERAALAADDAAGFVPARARGGGRGPRGRRAGGLRGRRPGAARPRRRAPRPRARAGGRRVGERGGRAPQARARALRGPLAAPRRGRGRGAARGRARRADAVRRCADARRCCAPGRPPSRPSPGPPAWRWPTCPPSGGYAPRSRTLYDRDPRVRAASARMLGEIGDEAALRPLVFSAARDLDGDVRREAVLAAASFGHDDTAIPFIRALGSENPRLVANAAQALADLGDPRALAFVVKRLTSHGSSARGVRLLHLNQVSYVRDYDVEIAQASNIANPDVATIQDGVVLDVRVIDAALHEDVGRAAARRRGVPARGAGVRRSRRGVGVVRGGRQGPAGVPLGDSDAPQAPGQGPGGGGVPLSVSKDTRPAGGETGPGARRRGGNPTWRPCHPRSWPRLPRASGPCGSGP